MNLKTNRLERVHQRPYLFGYCDSAESRTRSEHAKSMSHRTWTRKQLQFFFYFLVRSISALSVIF